MEAQYELIKVLSPLIILQFTLLLLAIRDWRRQPTDMPNRMIWLGVILFMQLLGSVAYFTIAPRVSNEEQWLEEDL